ncbi:hypothetical protein ACFE04_004474 [Oxalis oulophora]
MSWCRRCRDRGEPEIDKVEVSEAEVEMIGYWTDGVKSNCPHDGLPRLCRDGHVPAAFKTTEGGYVVSNSGLAMPKQTQDVVTRLLGLVDVVTRLLGLVDVVTRLLGLVDVVTGLDEVETDPEQTHELKPLMARANEVEDT